MAGLRERWKLTAMRTIQERALDLFDQRGFHAVTIEEIAAAAEVSPSSVYRYFGTKEGIVVADEFDRVGTEGVTDFLDPARPIDSLLDAVRTYEAAPPDAAGSEPTGSLAARRIRYFFAEPSVREAVLAVLDRAAARTSPLIAEAHDLPSLHARVLTNAIVFGYLAALEHWHSDGGDGPIAGFVERAMEPLREMFPSTAGSRPQ